MYAQSDNVTHEQFRSVTLLAYDSEDEWTWDGL